MIIYFDNFMTLLVESIIKSITIKSSMEFDSANYRVELTREFLGVENGF